MDSFDRDTWQTPTWIYRWLNNTFHFDVDLAAAPHNAKHPKFYTKDDNALEKYWRAMGKTGFCNPPYSNIAPWINKAIKETKNGFTTVMLIPTPNGESYYQQALENAAMIIFITGRLGFWHPIEKKEIKGNTRGSCVVVFAPKAAEGWPQISHVHRDQIKLEFDKGEQVAV